MKDCEEYSAPCYESWTCGFMVCCNGGASHPAMYFCLAPCVPRIGSRSTTTLTSIKHLLKYLYKYWKLVKKRHTLHLKWRLLTNDIKPVMYLINDTLWIMKSWLVESLYFHYKTNMSLVFGNTIPRMLFLLKHTSQYTMMWKVFTKHVNPDLSCRLLHSEVPREKVFPIVQWW